MTKSEAVKILDLRTTAAKRRQALEHLEGLLVRARESIALLEAQVVVTRAEVDRLEGFVAEADAEEPEVTP
jgi:hypothetical protein